VQPVPLGRRKVIRLSRILLRRTSGGASRRSALVPGLDRDLDVTLADPDLAYPAPAHEVHEPLDFLERQRFSTRLVLLCLIHVLHSLGFYTSDRGKVRPRK
jgi:hypothetical protein